MIPFYLGQIFLLLLVVKRENIHFAFNGIQSFQLHSQYLIAHPILSLSYRF